MSDTFLVQISLIVMFVAKALLDEWRLTRRREFDRRLAAELHENTIATIQGNEDVAKQIDSATRETTANAADAKKAASFAAARSVVIEKKADTLAKTASAIEERLNGGELGLGNRIAKNEARLDSLEKGQDAIARSVDNLTLGFAGFVADYKKDRETNHEHDKVGHDTVQ